jgi:uncharacterized membrane protein
MVTGCCFMGGQMIYWSPMIITLRLIHILAGVFWAGTAIFTAVFLIPSIRALGPGGGPVMQQIAQVRKLPLYFMGAGILSVLSGIGLYSKASGGFSNAWMHSGPGATFGIGAVFALAAMIVGMAVASPSAKRASALAATIHGAGRPPSPEQMAEMQRLQARMGKASTLGAVLLVLATAAMAIARYIP